MNPILELKTGGNPYELNVWENDINKIIRSAAKLGIPTRKYIELMIAELDKKCSPEYEHRKAFERFLKRRGMNN
tara:strand:- start:407 stop:628 length:222 start_codon:yes stop_codon:yes gene_type:complete